MDIFNSTTPLPASSKSLPSFHNATLFAVPRPIKKPDIVPQSIPRNDISKQTSKSKLSEGIGM